MEIGGPGALLNGRNNDTGYWSARLMSTKKIFWALAFWSIGLVSLSGGGVNVEGEQRPLVRLGRIQGELELVAESRVDEQGISGNKRKSKTKVFEERIRLKTEGDIYHPNFLFYKAAFGFGLTQQRFNFDDDSYKESALLNDYSVLAQLLRAKSCPLTVNLSKSEDLIARRFLGSLKAERESLGVSLALRSKDWPMTFQYSTSEISQDGLAPIARDFFTRDDERYRYTLAHDFSESSHLSFGFDRNKISQESLGASTDLTEDRYTLLHDLAFGSNQQHRIDSFFSFLDQSGSFNLENLQWEERLRLQHSSSLLTNYDFRFVDTKQERINNRETRGRAGFEHKLYESLVTTGNVFTSWSDLGAQGDLTQQGGTLGLNYRKTNPWGVLLSTYTTNFTGSDQSGGSGTGIVIDESHIFTDPLPITLDRVNIDISTIVVTDNTGLNVYTNPDDYTFTEINGRVRLNITTLGAIPPNVSDGQEILVDYTFFVEPKRKEDTLRQNFTIRERFDSGLSLYYAHQRQDEKISSSIVEITPDEFRINTFGADYVEKGLALLAEYSKESSTQIPSTSKRLEARYSWPIMIGTTVSVRASNQWLDLDEPDARDIELFRTGGEILSRLAEKFTISARIDYRNEDDSRFGITEGVQFNPELRYNYRQLSFVVGLELNVLKRRRDEIDSNFLYLGLKRFF